MSDSAPQPVAPGAAPPRGAAAPPAVPFDDRPGVIWLDGSLVPWRDARAHVLTHALHYGSSVFEGERCYGGRVFRAREHHERLARSAALMDFELPLSPSELGDAVDGLLARLGHEDAYVRPVAWRGSGQMGVSARGAGVRVAVAAWPWPSYFGGDAGGVSLATSRWRRPPPECAPVHSKAAGLYMICTLAKHEAQDAGFDDALMLDSGGNLAEGTGANLFLVIDGALHTPEPRCFLDGITRRVVVALARARGVEVVERTIPPSDLERAQEVFLTGTAVEVTPVGRIDGRRFQPGPVTRALAEDFAAEVRRAPGESAVGPALEPTFAERAASA